MHSTMLTERCCQKLQLTLVSHTSRAVTRDRLARLQTATVENITNRNIGRNFRKFFSQ